MYIPLNVKSHYSLLEGLSQPKQIAKRLEDLGLEGCVLVDNNLAGALKFKSALKKAGKKSVLGLEVKVEDSETPDVKNTLY